MSSKVELHLISGNLTARSFNKNNSTWNGRDTFTFEQPDILIFGRGDSCHAQIDRTDGHASRNHFILNVNPPRVSIRDLGSLNGTYVNGTKHGGRQKHESPEDAAQKEFSNIELHDRDQIRVGNTKFEISVEGASALNAQAETLLSESVSTNNVESYNIGMKDSSGHPVRSQRVRDPVSELQSILRRARKDSAEVPFHLEDYEIVKELGCGAMGKVFLAQRKADGFPLALKIMLGDLAVDEKSRKMFLRECYVAKQLRHPNVLQFFEDGAYEHGFFYTMEYCNGGSLRELVKERGGILPWEEAVPLAIQALDALAYAHNARLKARIRGNNWEEVTGIVHRDLKPENIFISGDYPQNAIVKVADMGLARAFETAGKSSKAFSEGNMLAGTPEFMPREQLIDFRGLKPVSDVWAMAATLYNVLTGYYPRDFPKNMDRVNVVLSQPVISILNRGANIPERLAEIIDFALNEDVKDRFQTAAAFSDALRLFIKIQ